MPPAGFASSRGWSIRRKAAAGFFLAFLALAGALFVTYLSTQRLIAGARGTTDLEARIDETEVILGGGALLQFGLLFALYFAVRREISEREQAADRLRKQLSFTAAITDNVGEGIYALDREGRVTFVNPAAQAALGWSEEELLGRNMHETIHFRGADGSPRPEKDCPLLNVLVAGKRMHADDEVFIRRGGEGFAVQCVSSPFRLDGEIVGAVVAFQDATERKKTEAEIVERARLAAFAAAVGAALTRPDTLDKALGLCAEAMVHHLGGAMASLWTLDEGANMLELKGSAWARRPLFGPDARVPVGEYRIGAIARDRKPTLLDLTARQEREDDKDWARNEGMVAFAGYPLIVEDRLVGVMALFATRPLTGTAIDALASVADEIALGIDRSRASEALRASEARTRAVVDSMMEGLLVVDQDIVIRSMNPSAERIFGYRADELVGQSLSRLVPDSASSDALSFMQEARRHALGRITQWEGRRKSGEQFPFELSLFEFRTPEGRRIGGSVRDVSESREVERLKKEFVSTVSHELRTPLTSIRGSLGLLAGGALGTLSSEAAEVVAVAERNVVRLVRLINDILDLERLDTGRLEMSFEALPLSSVFERSVEAVRAFADQEGVALESEPTRIQVRADGDRLVQVLVNLLSNAVKFSPRGASVRLAAAEEDGRACVRVTDRGRGVPPAAREAIFERFRQVEASDARQKGGTGLGLAICKAIVEQHGGAIGVESEEGRGSVFWFTVPVAVSGSREAVAPAGEPRAVGAGREVLLVEDDLALLDVLERQLAGAGLFVRRATTGQQGIRLAQQRRPDLLVLDVALPGKDGFEVVAALRTDLRLSSLPLLVYTVHDLAPEQRALLTLGPTRFLTKTRSSDEEFRTHVLEMLGHPADVPRPA